MRLWPRIAELQAEHPRRLTPRRLGWLEAISAPCVCGGVETASTLAAERAVVFAPAWIARRVVRGSVWLSALICMAYRPRDLVEAARELREYLSAEMWSPGRMIREGEETDNPDKRAFGTAYRLAVVGARLGFGAPSRYAKRSAWDAPCAEIVAHAACATELDRVAEYESRDEVERLVAEAAA